MIEASPARVCRVGSQTGSGGWALEQRNGMADGAGPHQYRGTPGRSNTNPTKDDATGALGETPACMKEDRAEQRDRDGHTGI